MVNTFRRLLLGASVCLSVNAIAYAPAMAGSLTNATVSGTAPYLTYDADATNTFLVPNSGSPTWANERKALTGNLASPTGNVELFSNSESLNNTAFATYTGVSNLNGQIGGRDITLSSLTAADWQTILPSGKTLARTWFDDALTAYNLNDLVGSVGSDTVFNAFVNGQGLQRFSDPNISYVNQDDTTGTISIGLAGHFNARDIIAAALPAQYGFLLPLPAVIQASELVKYSYNNGQPGYLYSFKAVSSGLVERGDGRSHTGTYEVTIPGIPPEDPTTSVPEPSIILALAGLGSFFTTQRKVNQA